MGKFNITYLDHDGEESGVGFHIIDLNAGNIAAQLALLATLEGAVDAVTLMAKQKTTVAAVTTLVGDPQPANAFAQREIKWLVSGVDAAGRAFQLEIPGADLALLPLGAKGLDLADAAEGQALKDAIEAVVRSATGQTVTVNAVTHVGRNI